MLFYQFFRPLQGISCELHGCAGWLWGCSPESSHPQCQPLAESAVGAPDVGLKPKDPVDMPRMLCFDALCVFCKVLHRRRSVVLPCVLCVVCMVLCFVSMSTIVFFSFLCLPTRPPNVWGTSDFILSIASAQPPPPQAGFDTDPETLLICRGCCVWMLCVCFAETCSADGDALDFRRWRPGLDVRYTLPTCCLATAVDCGFFTPQARSPCTAVGRTWLCKRAAAAASFRPLALALRHSR